MFGKKISHLLEVRNLRRVFAFSILGTTFCMMATMVHVSVNYPPELQPFVRGRATAMTLLVAFPMLFAVNYLMLLNWRLSNELRRLVNRDRLTNVATRDFFFQIMEDKPEQYGVSLMVDIDHFKRVNDTYGHLAGDAAIAHVAAILQAQVGPQDIVCRFGGEEFIIFLASSCLKDAQATAEALRAGVEAAVVHTEGQSLQITISIGGSLCAQAKDIENAIRQADEALYQAKNGGRNQVVMAASPAAEPVRMR